MAAATTKTTKSMRPGGGGRFAKLKGQLAKQGAGSPGGMAAWIGRKKHGKARMSKWSAAGRKRALAAATR